MAESKLTLTESASKGKPEPSTGAPEFGDLLSRHRKYFLSGASRSAEWRESQLSALQSMMKEHAEAFYAALWKDLRRNRIEAGWVDVTYMTSR